jgi:AraC-like DNA-binding protein
MDHFAALFRHFTPTAQAFFSGSLCTLQAFDDPKGMGHLHIFRGGRLTVTCSGNPPLELTAPAILLMPRHLAHSFIPDPDIGADLLCATIQIGGRQGNHIALGMPNLLVIPLDRIATIAPTLDLMVAEAFAAFDGRQIALDRLFEYLIIQTIRHVISEGIVSGGVLAALADPRLARTVTAMHDKPERHWKLDDLAEVAGMSRTAFARHFRAVSGSTAMDYLTRWRMTIAQNMLLRGKSIKVVAASVGYDSPAALSRTYSKIFGASPRQWLERQREG